MRIARNVKGNRTYKKMVNLKKLPTDDKSKTVTENYPTHDAKDRRAPLARLVRRLRI